MHWAAQRSAGGRLAQAMRAATSRAGSSSGAHQMVMEGADFRSAVTREDGSVDLHRFWQLWPHLRVLARCNPTDKLIIVKGAPARVLRGWAGGCQVC